MILQNINERLLHKYDKNEITYNVHRTQTPRYRVAPFYHFISIPDFPPTKPPSCYTTQTGKCIYGVHIVIMNTREIVFLDLVSKYH